MSHSKGIAIPATYKQAAADPNTDACLEIETGTLEEDKLRRGLVTGHRNHHTVRRIRRRARGFSASISGEVNDKYDPRPTASAA